MFDVIGSTTLIIAREGFESLLLTTLITNALPKEQKPIYYVNFIITWFMVFFVSWNLITLLTEYVEHIENIFKVLAGFILIYVFVNSRSIFAHAKEHVDQLDTSNLLMTNLTIFFIVAREASESAVFLRNNANMDFNSTMIGLILGSVAMLILLIVSNKLGEHITNKIVFRILGPLLIVAGIYYVITGSHELLELYDII